jgi:hypothetical protein
MIHQRQLLVDLWWHNGIEFWKPVCEQHGLLLLTRSCLLVCSGFRNQLTNTQVVEGKFRKNEDFVMEEE